MSRVTLSFSKFNDTSGKLLRNKVSRSLFQGFHLLFPRSDAPFPHHCPHPTALWTGFHTREGQQPLEDGGGASYFSAKYLPPFEISQSDEKCLISGTDLFCRVSLQKFKQTTKYCIHHYQINCV